MKKLIFVLLLSMCSLSIPSIADEPAHTKGLDYSSFTVLGFKIDTVWWLVDYANCTNIRYKIRLFLLSTSVYNPSSKTFILSDDSTITLTDSEQRYMDSMVPPYPCKYVLFHEPLKSS